MNHRRVMPLVMLAAALFIFLPGAPSGSGMTAVEGLKLTPDQFDFGSVDEGQPATVTVTVENSGNSRIDITSVRTS